MKSRLLIKSLNFLLVKPFVGKQRNRSNFGQKIFGTEI